MDLSKRRSVVFALAVLALALFGWAASLSRLPPGRAPSLGAVIPLSSLEAEFAEATLRAALAVASPVVVVYADHLSDGTPEDLGYIAALRAALRGERGLLWTPVAWHASGSSRFWVRYLRWAGFPFLDTDYVVWLDGDEVLDVARFRAWWASPRGLPASGARAAKLANFVYFRSPLFQSVELEDSVVVCRREGLAVAHFFSDAGKEREMFFDGQGGPRMQLALDGQPMVHHFSWVRSEAMMLKKVSAWSHRDDARDWPALVREEFARPFSGRDFVNGHTYRVLDRSWLETGNAGLGGGGGLVGSSGSGSSSGGGGGSSGSGGAPPKA
jgi:hypothetical protein